jgi:hypothetical protein
MRTNALESWLRVSKSPSGSQTIDQSSSSGQLVTVTGGALPSSGIFTRRWADAPGAIGTRAASHCPSGE